MSNDDKKKVVLGGTLTLLLGAGSYWFLGIGGGDSDGLNSSTPGKKAIRVVSTDGPKAQKGHRPPRARNGSQVDKRHRDPRVRQRDAKKGRRTREDRKVPIKLEKPRPAA